MTRRCSLLLLLIVATLFTACATAPKDGYRPPVAGDAWKAYIANWSKPAVLSGAWELTFQYADGDDVGLRADIVNDNGTRSRIDLSYSGSAVAVVTITPEFINLLNHREKYFLREETNPENADRLVGVYLPAQEASSLISGKGLDESRFSHTYPRLLGDEGISTELYHATENLKATAVVDSYGRLVSINYYDTATDRSLISASYLDFRLDKKSGIVWPGHVEIDLHERGERIVLQAIDVDINNDWVAGRLSHTFARLERGDRVYLKNVPPGPPLLYRSAKDYVEK